MATDQGTAFDFTDAIEIDAPGVLSGTTGHMGTMRHVIPQDVEWIDDVLDHWPASLRWDVKGWTPSRPELVSKLWSGVVWQRVAFERQLPVALMQIADLEWRNATARMECLVRDAAATAEHMPTFVSEVFDVVRPRTLSIHVGAEASEMLTSLSAIRQVGRLSGRLFRGRGQYEDIVLYEAGREEVGSG